MSFRGEQIDYRDAGAYLEEVSGPERGLILDLNRDSVSIGRAIDNDIVIESDAISRCHAFFVRQGGFWFVRDNRSKNGVLVNGVRVEEARLSSGDVIQVGDRVFRFNHPALVNGRPQSTYQRPAPTRIAQFELAQRTRTGWSVDSAFAPPSDLPGYPAPAPFAPPPRVHEENRIGPYAILIAVIFAGAFALWPRFASRGKTGQSAPVAAVPAPISAEPANAVPAARAPSPTERASVAMEPRLPRRKLTSAEVSKLDEKEELAVYLEEGKQFLLKGDFQAAAHAFQIALVIDPDNLTATRGIQAAEYKIRELDSASLDSLPNPVKPKLSKTEQRKQAQARRKQVEELLAKAQGALDRRSYSEAISVAEEARQVEVPGETAYLNEAKQIIDKARLRIRDEFEPFLDQARQRFDGGDFAASRDLCEEMLRRDPQYQAAKDCAARARARLDKIATLENESGGKTGGLPAVTR